MVVQVLFPPTGGNTMDELVNVVSQKTGVAADTVRPVATEVINFLKQKLPAPIAGQIDSFVGGQGSADVGGMMQNLGGMFGGSSDPTKQGS
jgi:hypothetical protein